MTHLNTKALAVMRRIARAGTLHDYETQLDLLKTDEGLWSQSLFRKWFEKTWLRQHKVLTLFLLKLHSVQVLTSLNHAKCLHYLHISKFH